MTFPNCSVPACKRKIVPPKQFVCREHFEMIPEEVRAEIKTHKKNRGGSVYKATVTEAIDKVVAAIKAQREADALLGLR